MSRGHTEDWTVIIVYWILTKRGSCGQMKWCGSISRRLPSISSLHAHVFQQVCSMWQYKHILGSKSSSCTPTPPLPQTWSQLSATGRFKVFKHATLSGMVICAGDRRSLVWPGNIWGELIWGDSVDAGWRTIEILDGGFTFDGVKGELRDAPLNCPSVFNLPKACSHPPPTG